MLNIETTNCVTADSKVNEEEKGNTVGSAETKSIPFEFYCSISGKIMLFPFSTADGEAYELEEIERWLFGYNKNTSPNTGNVLNNKELTECRPLKRMITGFLDLNPHLWDDDAIYVSARLTTNLIQAISDGNNNEINHILDIDRRYLTKAIEGKTLFIRLLEQNNGAVFQNGLKRIGEKLTALPEVRSDNGADAFRRVLDKFGSAIALTLANQLKWQQSDFQKQFWHGVINNQPGLVRTCLELKANPDDVCSDGRKAIHLASANGQQEMAKTILSWDPKQIDSKDAKGMTPLHHSIMHNHQPFVRFLLEEKANVHQADEGKICPLELFVNLRLEGRCSTDIGGLLLEYKADPNSKDGNGMPLFLKILNPKNIDVIKLFIKYGVDANLHGPNGEQAIFGIFKYHNEELVVLLELLLNCGANIESVNYLKQTPLLFATATNEYAAVKRLLFYHANKNALDSEGNSALHLAVANGFEDLVNLFLENDFNIDLKNKSGYTAEDIALANNNDRIAKKLSSKAISKKALEALQISGTLLQHDYYKYLSKQVQLSVTEESWWNTKKNSFLIAIKNADLKSLKELSNEYVVFCTKPDTNNGNQLASSASLSSSSSSSLSSSLTSYSSSTSFLSPYSSSSSSSSSFSCANNEPLTMASAQNAGNDLNNNENHTKIVHKNDSRSANSKEEKTNAGLPDINLAKCVIQKSFNEDPLQTKQLEYRILKDLQKRFYRDYSAFKHLSDAALEEIAFEAVND